MASLSIVVPTLGRPSLARTLESCRDADEVIVILDTARGTTELPCALPPNARLGSAASFGVTGGHAGRAAGIPLATGTHLAFMDDDDIYLPGAIQTMREAACDRPVIFRMDHYAHGILWREPVLEFGNVSTQMYVVPNDPARFGSWTPHIPGLKEPGGDYTFIRETCERMGGPVWRDEVVARLRPDRRSVAVVTPWLNTPHLEAGYLAAVEAGPMPDELIVVDNGSDQPPEFARVLNYENSGFCGGSNIGLEEATADVVVFLNSDIEHTTPGWLYHLANAVEPGVLAGAQLRVDRHAWVDGHPMPYLDGWCLAGMRDDLLELGGWDETLTEPAYYSDNLLCMEARAAGFSLREVPVGLTHLVNGSVTPKDRAKVREATLANREVYVARARELLVKPGPEAVGATR